MSQAGGDVGGAGEAEQADRGVAEGGHHLGSVAGTDLGAVFVVDDVADPVGAVLDSPVALDPGAPGRAVSALSFPERLARPLGANLTITVTQTDAAREWRPAAGLATET